MFSAWVIWLNLVGAAVAIPVNLLAARRGFLASSWVHSVIAVFAGIYACGYALLLTGTVPLAEWGECFRGVSIAVWWVGPWMLPALVSLHMWRRVRTEVVVAAQRQVVADDADRR